MVTLSLSGKQALVCGASAGIGRAIALKFAESGASVTVVARTASKLDELLQIMPEVDGAHHQKVVADFANVKETIETFELLVNNNPPFEIIVHNSGGPKPGLIHKAEVEHFDTALQQHLFISHRLTQLLLEGMKQSGYGRIINILSTSTKQPIANLGVSNTVRAAMTAWSKTISGELAPFGITVNNILPGFIQTGRLDFLISNMALAQNKSESVIIDELLQSVPLGTFGKPEELANVALFLASPLASYITGVSLCVDGGRTITLT